jgi:purine-cytosine permease-like protein
VDISPDDERKSRFLKYTIAMIVRVICIILAVVVPLGWVTILFAIGAIFLPYFAVIIANTDSRTTETKKAKAQAPTISISADSFRDSSETTKE